MCIMRCAEHEPQKTKREYAGSVKPFGYPETALVCGSSSCENPALIWLERDERTEYEKGIRIFKSFTATMKVRAA